MNREMVLISSCLFLVLFIGCRVTSQKSPLGPGNPPRLASYAPEICLDTTTGLMWRIAEIDKDFGSWRQASRHVADLQAGGFNDWRLPTHEELYILWRILDRKDYGDCRLELKGAYWTGNTERAARVGFWDSEPLCGGPSYFFVKKTEGSVIAVRMTEALP